MVQYKYAGMAESLYRFFRGTNHIFCEDYADSKTTPHAPLAWICGDLHLENFGSFKSDNRLVYFDLNDFDDAILAPATHELVRFITSIFIAFETLQIEQKKALHMAELFLKKYSSVLASGKANYLERQTATGIVANFLDVVSRRKSKNVLQKKAALLEDEWRLLVDNKKHHKLDRKLKSDLHTHLTHWLKHDEHSPYNYKILDIVFRVAGTGSLGLKRYMALLKSSNDNGDKYIMVEMKQAAPSPVKLNALIKQPKWPSEAERVIGIQKRMQNHSPALLSATVFKDESFIVEELQPTRDSIDFNLIGSNYRDMCQVIDDMAMLTASAQLRSSGRQGSAITDDFITFGNNSKWQSNIINSAIEYSHQIKLDYLHFLSDYRNSTFKS